MLQSFFYLFFLPFGVGVSIRLRDIKVSSRAARRDRTEHPEVSPGPPSSGQQGEARPRLRETGARNLSQPSSSDPV